MNFFDLIVSIRGQSGQFREDVEEDKAVLDDLLASIGDKDLSIRVEDADAQAKLDDLDAKLADLKDAHAKINLNDADATLKYDDFKAKLDALRNATAAIRLDDAVAKGKLDDFKLKLEDVHSKTVDLKIDDLFAEEKLKRLSGRIDTLFDKTVDIEVDTKRATAEVDKLKAELTDMHNKAVKIDIHDTDFMAKMAEMDAALNGLETKIDEINARSIDPKGSAGGAGGGAGLWSWLLTFLPALAPLTAAATGGAMGLAGAFTAAGAGALGFGVVAAANIKSVTTAQQQLKTAQDAVTAAQAKVKSATTYQQWLTTTQGLTQAQQQLAAAQAKVGPQIMQEVGAVNQFSSAWKSFNTSLEPTVIQAMLATFKFLEQLMTDMKPVIQAAGGAITQLINGATNALKGSTMQQFFTWLAQNAGPMILTFGRSAGNIFQGLSSIIMAFTPVMNQMSGGWLKMTTNFASWAAGLSKSQGFKDFLAYVQKEGPQVLQLIGNLGTLIGHLLVAMAPSGANLLAFANAVLHIANAILGANPLIGQLVVGGGQAFGIFKLLSPVFGGLGGAITKFAESGVASFLRVGGAARALGSALTLMTGPWGIVLSIVIAGALLIISHWSQVSAEAQKLWKDVSQFFSSLGKDISRIWDEIKTGVVNKWNEIKTQLETYAKNAWKDVTDVFDKAKGYFTKIWGDLKTFFATWGPDMLLVIAPFIGVPLYIYQHFDKIKGYFTGLWNDIKGIWNGFVTDAESWGENLIHSIAQGITNAIGSIKSAVSNAAGAIKSFLGFHSPTEEGPGSEADQWMPNMMNMFVRGIEQGIPSVHDALSRVMVPPNVGQMVATGASYGSSAATAQGHTFQFQFNAPIYGVDDLQQTIKDAVYEHVIPAVKAGVRQPARAAGVSK